MEVIRDGSPPVKQTDKNHSHDFALCDCMSVGIDRSGVGWGWVGLGEGEKQGQEGRRLSRADTSNFNLLIFGRLTAEK